MISKKRNTLKYYVNSKDNHLSFATNVAKCSFQK
jgi:hypothetical protein